MWMFSKYLFPQYVCVYFSCGFTSKYEHTYFILLIGFKEDELTTFYLIPFYLLKQLRKAIVGNWTLVYFLFYKLTSFL